MYDLESAFAGAAVQAKISTERKLVGLTAEEAVLRDTLRTQVATLLTELPDYNRAAVVQAIEWGHFWLRPAGDPQFVIGSRALSSYPHVRSAYIVDAKGVPVPLVVKMNRQDDPGSIQMERRNAMKIAQHQARGLLKGLVAPQFILGETRDDVVVYECVQDAQGDCTTFTSISADDGKISDRNIKHLLHMLLEAGRSLQEMHAQGLSHQDFRDEQLFVGKDRLQVGDFGSVVSLDETVHLLHVASHNYTGLYRLSPKPTGVCSHRGFYRWRELFMKRVPASSTDRTLIEPAILKHFDTVAFMLVVLDMLLLSNGTRREYENNNIRPILLSGRDGDVHYALQIGCRHYLARHPGEKKRIFEHLLEIWQQSKKLWTLEPGDYLLADYIRDLQLLCDLLPDEKTVPKQSGWLL